MPGMKSMADSQTEDDTKASPFSLKNTGSTFEGRSKDIFGSLGALEEKHEAYEKKRTTSGEHMKDESLWKTDPDDDYKSVGHDDPGTRSYRGRGMDRYQQGGQGRDFRDRSPREGEYRHDDDDSRRSGRREFERGQPFRFRRPRGRAPGRQQNRVPDFRKHPERWTYYSLEDVEGADMSESSNKQAAFAFLEERRKLREEENQEEKFDTSTAACSKGLISFSKKSKSATVTSDKSSSKETSSTVVNLSLPDSGDSVTSEVSGSVDTSVSLDSDLAEGSSEAQGEGTSVGGSTFKKRSKGAKRNIRARDTDDD